MEHAQEFSEECVGDDGSGDGGMERRSNPRLAQYHFLHTIWVGNQSTVRSAKYKPTGDIFAVKTYTHSVTPAAGAAETWMPGGSAENVDILVRRKRRIFAKVGYNPNVVRLIEYFQSGYKSYFVFELAGGGVCVVMLPVPRAFRVPFLRCSLLPHTCHCRSHAPLFITTESARLPQIPRR